MRTLEGTYTHTFSIATSFPYIEIGELVYSSFLAGKVLIVLPTISLIRGSAGVFKFPGGKDSYNNFNGLIN